MWRAARGWWFIALFPVAPADRITRAARAQAEAQFARMHSTHKEHAGWERIARATGYSWAGLCTAYRSEKSFRQECWLAAVLLPLAGWLGRNWVEVTLLIGSVLMVLVVELLNSGIEAAVDRVSLDLHDLSKRAKDLASAAVFLSMLMCAGVWISAFIRWFA